MSEFESNNRDVQPPHDRSEEELPTTRQQVEAVMSGLRMLTDGGRELSTSDGDWTIVRAYAVSDDSPIEQVELVTRLDEHESSPVLAEVEWRDEVAGSGSKVWQVRSLDGEPVLLKVPNLRSANHAALLEEYAAGLHCATFADARRLTDDLRDGQWSQ